MWPTPTQLASPPRRFAVPIPPLRPFVERIWSWEARAGAPLPVVLPGTGAELVLHLGVPFAVEDQRGVRTALPQAHLFSLRTWAARLVAPGRVHFVAARFRSGALRHFTRVPLAELADRFAPLEDLLAADAAALHAAVAAAPGFPEQVACIEAVLLRLLHRRGASASSADAAAARLYYRAGTERVSDAARALGLSFRQLQRITRRELGLSPKRFQRIARFHHTMRRLLLEHRRDYLDVALEHGFYDQAHFVHDVRALTGRAPGQLLTAEQFASHFYNPSLRLPGQPALQPGKEPGHGRHAGGEAEDEGGG